MSRSEGSAPTPFRTGPLRRRAEEARNLLVPVCLSASHIAYGSIRMEPVFMVLAQSSAIAACQAIDRCGGCVQRVDVAAVMDEFAGNPLADGSQPGTVRR